MPPEPFPVSPADFAMSELFERTFDEGMDLVEETAAYLEGPGRESSRALSRQGALAYAGESMRLTTRLMQIASWLLVHRAVRDGEMTDEDARNERFRLAKARENDPPPFEGRDELPAKLLDLHTRCDRLFSRVVRLDERLFSRDTADCDPNPVGEQLARLETLLRDRGPGDARD